jgi:hypothetical protein
MSDKELVQRAKEVMNDLSADNNMLEHEQAAYNCLRLFCERIEQTKSLVVIIKKLEMYVTESEMRKQTGVLITNKQALDIAKFVPLYHD